MPLTPVVRAWIIGILSLAAISAAVVCLLFVWHGSFIHVRSLTILEIGTMAAAVWRYVKDMPAIVKLPGELEKAKADLARVKLELEVLQRQARREASPIYIPAPEELKPIIDQHFRWKLNPKSMAVLSTILLFAAVCIVSAEVGALPALAHLASSAAQNKQLRDDLDRLRMYSFSEPEAESLRGEVAELRSKNAMLTERAIADESENQKLRKKITELEGLSDDQLPANYLRRIIDASDAFDCRSYQSVKTPPAVRVRVAVKRDSPTSADGYLIADRLDSSYAYDLWERGKSGLVGLLMNFKVADGKELLHHFDISRGERSADDSTYTWDRDLTFVLARHIEHTDPASFAPERQPDAVICPYPSRIIANQSLP